MDVLNSLLGTASRLVLLILSVYFFNRATSAPVHNPTLPPFGPSLSEKREWLFIRVILYVYPLLRILYMITAVFECLTILNNYFSHPLTGHIRFLIDQDLPPSTQSSQPPGHIANIGLLIGVLGGLLRVLSFQALGNSFTFNIGQSPKLVTTGPYSLVRHPSYLGGSLMVIGITAYHLSYGSWLRESDILNHIVWRTAVGLWVFTTIFITNVCHVLRVQDEDRLMEKAFGDEWETWRRSVRYKMIPGLY